MWQLSAGIESFVVTSLLVGMCPLGKFSEVLQHECMRIFTAALLALAKVWNQLNIML